ncbi:MAG: winged helix-turn-helix transcriptional regulator [Candidatus Nitrosopelagicus sp.]|nr:winged helix-turn-helix transcriptional regulator [Candidatus Nitrosopelagicus sp.]
MDRSKIILDVIEKNPGIRFNEIMRITEIRNGTLSYYVKKLEDGGNIELQRTPRVTRLYPVGISKEEAKICKHMTKLTQKKIIQFLLEKENATSIEIRDFVKKSPSVVSVNLSELFREKILNKEYDIPSNKYSLKNPEQIKAVLSEYFPTEIDHLTENTVELLDL